jgi:hypothetical protein
LRIQGHAQQIERTQVRGSYLERHAAAGLGRVKLPALE